MTALEKQCQRVRTLVEDAGFVLAMSLDRAGMFRILANDSRASVVASVSVTGSGFRAFFPGQQLQVATATELVDALERFEAAS
ncbi:MAG: hypothetical protein WED09_07365 [Homoserinimonas sp.]